MLPGYLFLLSYFGLPLTNYIYSLGLYSKIYRYFLLYLGFLSKISILLGQIHIHLILGKEISGLPPIRLTYPPNLDTFYK